MQETSHIWTIIPAAGIGQRMNASLPKQYLKLHDKTVLEHTFQALFQHPLIKQATLCLNPQDEYWQTLPMASNTSIVTTHGGATRALSVLNGLKALEGTAKANDWVLVHDAARPCISIDSLNKLITEIANDSVGGLLAIPSKDTLKYAHVCEDGSLKTSKTLDRSIVWRAQTPQMFRYGVLTNALKEAIENGVEITDEASAIEYAGLAAKLIEGDENNFKITTPDDLALAEKLLK